MDFDLKPFGLNIRAERARNRLTQAHLAISLDVTPDELMGFSP